ncbi:unnamed protein product, partial [Pylaiella littoralis]
AAWATEQQNELLCAATLRYHSLGLPNNPSTHFIDNFLPAYADRLLPHRSAGSLSSPPPSSHTETPSRPDVVDVVNFARLTCLHRTDDDTTLLVMLPKAARTSKLSG